MPTNMQQCSSKKLQNRRCSWHILLRGNGTSAILASRKGPTGRKADCPPARHACTLSRHDQRSRGVARHKWVALCAGGVGDVALGSRAQLRSGCIAAPAGGQWGRSRGVSWACMATHQTGGKAQIGGVVCESLGPPLRAMPCFRLSGAAKLLQLRQQGPTACLTITSRDGRWRRWRRRWRRRRRCATTCSYHACQGAMGLQT